VGRQARSPVKPEQLRVLLSPHFARLGTTGGCYEYAGNLAEAIRQSPVWREKDELLRSVPGVGPVLTSTLLAGLSELGTLTNKQIAPSSA